MDGSSITQIFDTITSQVAYPIYYGLIGLVAIVALIVLLKELIGGATTNNSASKNEHWKQCAVILVICIILGFAPGIINWFIGLAGGSVSGVNV